MLLKNVFPAIPDMNYNNCYLKNIFPAILDMIYSNFYVKQKSSVVCKKFAQKWQTDPILKFSTLKVIQQWALKIDIKEPLIKLPQSSWIQRFLKW